MDGVMAGRIIGATLYKYNFCCLTVGFIGVGHQENPEILGLLHT